MRSFRQRCGETASSPRRCSRRRGSMPWSSPCSTSAWPRTDPLLRSLQGPASSVQTTTPAPDPSGVLSADRSRLQAAEELVERLQRALSSGHEAVLAREAELAEWRAGLLLPRPQGEQRHSAPLGSGGRPDNAGQPVVDRQRPPGVAETESSSGSANSFSLDPGALELSASPPALTLGEGDAADDQEGGAAAGTLADEVVRQQRTLSRLKAQVRALNEEVLARQRACQALELEQVELLHTANESGGGIDAVAHRELEARCTALEAENAGLQEHSRAVVQEIVDLKLQLLKVQQAMEMQEYHMHSREALLEVQRQRSALREALPGPVLRSAITPNNRHLEEALLRQEGLLARLQQTIRDKDEEIAALRSRLPCDAVAASPPDLAGPQDDLLLGAGEEPIGGRLLLGAPAPFPSQSVGSSLREPDRKPGLADPDEEEDGNSLLRQRQLVARVAASLAEAVDDTHDASDMQSDS
eukprot:GGOE01001094.1.p1 GENE.GGOE01001094.1~~GGOE01001094.1.p1  ORF type:complete len:471 (+),score=101.83 GGOE01001094.1:736-2148(+)